MLLRTLGFALFHWSLIIFGINNNPTQVVYAKNCLIFKSTMERKNYFKYFDPTGQLRPKFSRKKFNELKDWDLAWEILEPINIATTRRSEIALSKKLSPGQKALYFFWYLDTEVENGGFIQFYYNKYDHYLPSILEGLSLLKDKQIHNLVNKADELFQKNEGLFKKATTIEAFSRLYEKIKDFSKLDDKYYRLRDKTIALIEKCIRENPNEFVSFK